MSPDHHLSSPEELRQRLAAERAGLPFLLYHGHDGSQQLVVLRDEQSRLTIGRGERTDIRLELDAEASRLHAELQRVGDRWVVDDDGLSRNGTFVNAERVNGRRSLRDADTVRCGATVLTFHDPSNPSRETTRPSDPASQVRLSDGQERVLTALCRPLLSGSAYALPASNRAIGDELFLSTGAVKDHMRALFDKLAVEDLPHGQKRLRLVERAIESGLVRRESLG